MVGMRTLSKSLEGTCSGDRLQRPGLTTVGPTVGYEPMRGLKVFNRNGLLILHNSLTGQLKMRMPQGALGRLRPRSVNHLTG